MSRVLLCKVGGLGDSLSVLPVVHALLQAGVELRVLASPVGRAVLGGFFPGLRFAGWGTRAEVALLSYDERTTTHLRAALAAPRRIGFASGIAKGRRLLTEALPFDPTRPVVDHAFDLARVFLEQPDRSPAWPPPPVARQDGGYGVIHAGAAHPLQRWPHMAEARIALEAATGFPWRLVGGDERLPMPAFLALLAGARGVVGNHSGPVHLAAALGVPWLALAGPSAREWDPWPGTVGQVGAGQVLRAGLPCQPCGRVGAPARTCPHGGTCLSALSVAAVVQAVRSSPAMALSSRAMLS